MNYATTIILSITLITLFCCLLGWCLMNSCRRVITAELYDLSYQRDLEAATGTAKSSSNGSKAAGSGNGGGGVQG